MTHTPGPWKVRALNVQGQEIILRTHGEMTIGAPETYAVASVPLRHVSINGQLANARLIAAAPDMLDALKDAEIEMCGWVWSSGAAGKGPHDERLARIRAAIAKAEGKI
jgi:hypothetical protein